MFNGPYNYKLILSGEGEKRRIDKKIQEGKIVNFSKPLTNNKQPKLYIIRIEEEIVYVGYTSQSISSRLNSGLKAKYGYKWRTKRDEFRLSVYVFVDKFIGDKDKDDDYYHFVEAIEAELVFLVRYKTGNWPKYQNEIHFHQNQSIRVKGIAENLLEFIEKK